MPSAKRRSRLVVAGMLGFYALVAQTLLFRDFLTVFEGNELGISAFFTSWLLWVAVGALLGRAEVRAMASVTRRFPLLALLYIPAFLLQRYLVLHARGFVGVEAYEMFPFMPMFGMAFIANAPVSLLTGLLFTLACRWTSEITDLPVSRVYIAETLGSCLGGLFVTLELSTRVPHEGVFVVASCYLLLLNAGSVVDESRKIPRVIRNISLSALATLAIASLFLSDSTVMIRWTQEADRAAWSRLLPQDAYRGTFATARGRYLYGERAGQFIVMSGAGVCDTLPPDEHAAEVVALHLAQKPDARRMLVFGGNTMGLCAEFKKLPQVAQVTWMHPDHEYPTGLWHLMNDQTGYLQSLMFRDTPEEDIRTWARETDKRYDLIVLNLPDVTTLALNRYCTEEFFALLKRILAENGVVSARVSGGANYLGGELAYLGSSLLHTIESAFKHVVIKPGDETWFLASDGDGLAQAPAVLRDRFATVQGASGIYPPEGILGLYPPDRADFQLKAYRNIIAETAPALLRNTDREPKALSYGLFLAIKQAEWRLLAAALPNLFRVGAWVFLVPVILYGLLRCVYLLKTPRRLASDGVFDIQFLVFSTGLASMALSIVLMFLYQARFGSLVMDIGLVVAIFMLGSSVGGFATNRSCAKEASSDVPVPIASRRRRLALSEILFCHANLLMLVSFLPDIASRALWFLLIGLAGFFTGVYFPIAAFEMKAAARSVAQTGSSLETLDHLGGALGALVTGLLMLPILGGATTLWIVAALVAVNLAPTHMPTRRVEAPGFLDRIARPLGYTAFGIAAYLLIVSQVVALQRAADEGKILREAARDMAAGADLREEQASLLDGALYSYFTVADTPERPGGYVFSTARWASRIPGYGGPISLAVYADREGILRDYRVLRSNETPAYMALVDTRRQRLIGRRVFDPDPFSGVELVTGATISWNAITEIFETAGRGFAAEVLGKGSLEPEAGPARFDWTDPQLRDFACLAGLAALALVMRYRPNVWVRRAFLLIVLVVTGWLLNLQYSMQHVMSLLSLNFGTVGLNAPFLLVLILPVIVALFGNVYCGYLCPFGALQELAGDLNARNRSGGLDKRTWQCGRTVKYGLLFLLVVVYALTRDFGTLRADPLITLFGIGRDRFIVAVAAVCVGLSVFFPRFWCRSLCPAGAFLSLFNGISLLRRFMPARYPNRCDLGVRNVDDLDCICCDRCQRRAVPAEPEPLRQKSAETIFLSAVAILALVLTAHTVSAARTYLRSVASATAAVPGAAGKPRNLDLDRIRQLIRQRQLSDHEAQFYVPAPSAPTQETTKPNP